MCKDFSQAICGPKGSYCEDDATEPDQFKGLPTAISKYPHTVGLQSGVDSKNKINRIRFKLMLCLRCFKRISPLKSSNVSFMYSLKKRVVVRM